MPTTAPTPPPPPAPRPAHCPAQLFPRAVPSAWHRAARCLPTPPRPPPGGLRKEVGSDDDVTLSVESWAVEWLLDQILGRLPRKPGKTGDSQDAVGPNGNEPSNSYSVARNPTKNLKEKESKCQMLMELIDYVASANGKFSEAVMLEITKMVSINLFRSSSPTPRENKAIEGVDPEEEEPLMD
ncbi:hypothetical protein ABZP36_008675 [Zizania latifolia]